jgi:DMSO/TMAO reductase YedYZ molybdopterin-dependent catalytic subunit
LRNLPPASSSLTTGPTTAHNSKTAESPTVTPGTSSVFDIDINSYRLVINGLVNTPLSLSYEQIQSYPTVTEKLELVCLGVEDQTEEWTGVPVSALLAEADLMPGPSEVVFTGVDGYSIELPLDSVQQSEAFLAYLVDGQTLTQWRGYPLRLVLSGSQKYRGQTNIGFFFKSFYNHQKPAREYVCLGKKAMFMSISQYKRTIKKLKRQL